MESSQWLLQPCSRDRWTFKWLGVCCLWRHTACLHTTLTCQGPAEDKRQWKSQENSWGSKCSPRPLHLCMGIQCTMQAKSGGSLGKLPHCGGNTTLGTMIQYRDARHYGCLSAVLLQLRNWHHSACATAIDTRSLLGWKSLIFLTISKDIIFWSDTNSDPYKLWNIGMLVMVSKSWSH